MSKKSKISDNLGRSLIKNRFGHTSRKGVNYSMHHTTEVQDGYDWGRLNLQSVTEQSSFQEFLASSELAGTEFQAEKLNVKFVNSSVNAGLLTREQRKEIETLHEENKHILKIPRRPFWNETTTPEELEENEKVSFLEWRRNLASLQEKNNIILTPYEKNLEFWRQLWRVIERSDIIVQIVDARNPLLFRCEDLELYVKEISKSKLNILLVNKADFLNEEQRQQWASYFTSVNIIAAFFSATKLSIYNDDDDDNDEKDQDYNTSKCLEQITQDIRNLKTAVEVSAEKLAQIEDVTNISATPVNFNSNTNPKYWHNSSKVFTRDELIEFFKSIHIESKVIPNVTTIGLVGYPNVGKSTTINTLLQTKKVSVSATPGRTKHFQTIYLDEDILLCDCPGLVMPSFVFTKAEMYINGILPIDQMRDHVPAINLICHLIPRHILEDVYGIILPPPLEGEDPNRCPSPEELLNIYGYNRGFMTANGQPDNARASRYILKDFVSGKLLYANAPPNIDQNVYHPWPTNKKKQTVNRILPSGVTSVNKPYHLTTVDLDRLFFHTNSSGVHVKGKSVGIPNSLRETHSQELTNAKKPWKKVNKHQNKNKHEKLRRIYANLDN